MAKEPSDEARVDEKDKGLVEPQGVNAEDDETGEDKETRAAAPDERSQLSDEMVGLPEQKPGYPGQQGSVGTS
jgi:hypothetical protein